MTNVAHSRQSYESRGWHVDAGVEDESDQIAFFQTAGATVSLCSSRRSGMDRAQTIK